MINKLNTMKKFWLRNTNIWWKNFLKNKFKKLIKYNILRLQRNNNTINIKGLNVIDVIQLRVWKNSKARVAPQNTHSWLNNITVAQGISRGVIEIRASPPIKIIGMTKNHFFEKMDLLVNTEI